MKYACLTFFLIHFASTQVFSQQEFEDVFQIIASNIRENNFPFKATVFLTEKVSSEHLNQQKVDHEIDFLLRLIKLRIQSDSLQYKGKDIQTVKVYASIFKVLSDTIRIEFPNNSSVFEHLPFHYDFDDIFGAKHWEKMFVSKLLATRKGNCHSMPYLYKILCEELGVPCHLALAPNHLYVKHRSEKAGWYNTELTSASFPMDAWLMASGYITLQAIQNGIYMDALDDKQCIALCVLDLAKGFDRKYPDNDGTFIVKCCDLTLAHFPKCINAMLFKAETRKKQFERLMKTLNRSNPAMVRLQPEGQKLWAEMNGLYAQIHRLGYRTMPEQMYVDWLVSLQKEREKYANKQIIEGHK